MQGIAAAYRRVRKWWQDLTLIEVRNLMMYLIEQRFDEHWMRSFASPLTTPARSHPTALYCQYATFSGNFLPGVWTGRKIRLGQDERFTMDVETFFDTNGRPVEIQIVLHCTARRTETRFHAVYDATGRVRDATLVLVSTADTSDPLAVRWNSGRTMPFFVTATWQPVNISTEPLIGTEPSPGDDDERLRLLSLGFPWPLVRWAKSR